MPNRTIYKAIRSEVLRRTFAREKLKNLITTLLTKVHRQGCQNTLLQRLLKENVKNFEKLKDIDKENVPSNKTPAFTRSMNIGI